MKTPIHTTQVRSRLAGFKRSLLQNVVLLTVVTCGAVLLVVIFGSSRVVRELSRTIIAGATERTESELRRFFATGRASLLVGRVWGREGLLDLRDVESMNRLFIPVLAENPQISSMMLADSTGREYMLLHEGDKWRNRLTDPGSRAGHARAFRWSSIDVLEEQWEEETDYDPRLRPWFRGAIELEDGEAIHKTLPYTFFTTKDPGITASVRWTEDGSPVTHVLAFDFLLQDISRFTSSLEVSPRGMALVFTDEGMVVGLPRSEPSAGDEALDEHVLSPVTELGIPPLEVAIQKWELDRSLEAPLSFRSGGESWWAGFKPYAVDHGRSFWIAVIVPEADFMAEARRQRNLVLAIGLAAVVVAALLSLFLARTVRRTLQQAVAEASRLGQYTLVKKIGEGGMGAVYRARHALLRRPTAVKLLRPDLARSEAALARFEREVQLSSSLTHPNTIQIYDYGHTPAGIFYYVMEYLVGFSLQTLVVKAGPFSPGRVIHILRQCCGSLEEAHEVGLIHRDIKPQNIMLCERGAVPDVVKVLDFGLVKEVEAPEDSEITQEGVIAGTPLYLSPEMISTPKEVDARSDIYQLGAVGYFLLTGNPPFEGDTALQICSRHLTEEPAPLSSRLGEAVPGDLERVILTCLEKRPEKRFATAMDLATALERCESAGTWSRDDAARWWKEHGDKLAGGAEEPVAPTAAIAETLDVDMGARTE